MPNRPRGLDSQLTGPVLDPPTLDPETEALELEISEILGEDDGPPSGAHHGETHTRRAERAEALARQGPKTRAANRERAKGSRLHNPR
jgi:hypothetical protein